jgi:hypothetical protein
VGERDDEHQRTREVGVVRGVRVDVESRERSLAHLVGDPSGLLVAPFVRAVALHSAELREARVEEGALVEHRRLPSGGQRVAAEQCGVQRNARLDREPLVGAPVEQRKGGQVLGALLHQLLHVGRARDLHPRESFAPPPLLLEPPCDVVVGETRSAVEGGHADADVLSLLRLERDGTVEPTLVRVPCAAALRVLRTDRRLERELGVLIAKPHAPANWLDADGGDLFARAGLRFLHVGEVGVEHPGHGEGNRLARPIGERQLGVQPVEARPEPEPSVDRALADAVRISPRRVVRDVGTAAAEARQLRIHVDEVQLVVSGQPVGAKPRSSAVDLDAESPEVSRLAEVVAAERIALAALPTLVGHEEGGPEPDVALAGLYVGDRGRHPTATQSELRPDI